MIEASKLRNGVCFSMDGQAYKVVEYKHKHLSRGGGVVKVKIRSLSDGRLASKTFKSNEKFEEIEVVKRRLQYLYKDGSNYIFMDPVSFEQLEIGVKVIGENGVFLKDGEEVVVLFWDDGLAGSPHGKPLDLDLPPKMVFAVAEAPPGEKGDSASNVYKDAKLENGLKVKVPLFVNAGDKVRVDTRSGEYVERA